MKKAFKKYECSLIEIDNRLRVYYKEKGSKIVKVFTYSGFLQWVKTNEKAKVKTLTFTDEEFFKKNVKFITDER